MHTGSLVPLVQSAKDLNKLQRYLSGHCMVNDAKLAFHPNIKLRRVYKTIFFSHPFAAAFAVEIWAQIARIISTGGTNYARELGTQNC